MAAPTFLRADLLLLESIPIALPPARVAASIPLDVSSKIQISSFKRVELRGRACRQLRKISGLGLPCVTSSAVKTV
jgi:hypothetical protein